MTPATLQASAAPLADLVGFMNLLEAWYVHLGATGKVDRTRDTYTYAVVKFFSEVRVAPEQLTEDDVARWVDRKRGQPQWVKQVLKAIRSFYAWLRRRGHVDHNPAEELRAPRQADPDPDALDADEFYRATYAAACRGPRRAWAVVLLLETGARIGSMAAVRPEDVPSGVGEDLRFRVAKNDRPYSVPLSPLGFVAAQELLGLYEPNSRGTLLGVTSKTLWSWYHKAAVDAGLPSRRRRPHVLRDTFLTNLVERGVPIDVVVKLANHADPSTTLKRYVLTRRHRVRDAMTESSFPGTIASV